MTIRKNGFTLIEVMVALLIMAVLSLVTAQALKSGVDNRSFVSRELGRDAQLADAIRIIRADVAQAFHFQDIACKMTNEIIAPPQPTPQVGAIVPPPGTGAPGATPKPCPASVTGFIGGGDAMYFTTVSNVRTLRDSPESDQAKVGYYLKGCKSRGDKGVNSSSCLYRSISPYLDEEIDKPGPETPLLENVEEFKLRYLGPGVEDYVDKWETGKNGDDTTKDIFPYAVEITLAIHNKNDPKDRPAATTVLAPIAFQNNAPKRSKKGTGEGGIDDGNPGENL